MCINKNVLGVGCNIPVNMRVPARIVVLNAFCGYAEKEILKRRGKQHLRKADGSGNDPDPCTPIEDLTPPNASQLVKQCCLEERADYLTCLLGCDNESCCEQCEILYRAGVAACIAAGNS